jgi:hypothetical protein
MTQETNAQKIAERHAEYKQREAQTKFTPPFKRLNQKELLECLAHGWTGRATFVKPAEDPGAGAGKYAKMGYNTLLRKGAYVSATVFPSNTITYRMVDYSVVAALKKKGLVTVTFVSVEEAVFKLAAECPKTEEAPQ